LSHSSKIDRLLGEAYAAHQARQSDVAEKLYRHVLEMSPKDSDAANLLGLLYIEEQRFPEARNVIQRAIAIQPNNSQSHYNIGIAAKGCGDPVAAIGHFQESTRLIPGNIEAWVALGNMQKLEHRFSDAAESYRRALAIDSSHHAAKTGLSDTLNDAGVEASNKDRYEEALQLYREALEANTSNAKAALNLGMLLEQLGDGESAAEAFKTSIDAKPDFADSHFQLAHLKHHASSLGDVKAMETLFASDAQSDKSKALLAYGLGKAWEKLGDYGQEFTWLMKAHDLMAKLEAYEPGTVVAQFSSLKQIFSKDLIEQVDGDNGSKLAFIVGMPRSGTSLTEQILASHGSVFGAGEQMTANNAISRLQKEYGAGSYPNRLRELADNNIDAIASNLTELLTSQSSGESLIIDTTPSNFIHIGLLAVLFPRARFIHCTRNPLDTCLSIYQHPLSEAHAYSHNLKNLAGYFVHYRHLMDHWQSILPGRIYEHVYEQVVDDFETSVRSLLDYCGLPFDQACLEFHKTRRVIKTPSASQVRQPIYSSSIGRWKRYSEQLAPLKEELQEGLGVSLD